MPRGPRKRGSQSKPRAHRASSTRRGYGYRWEQYSRQRRATSDGALCAICLDYGRTTTAECVDHIEPVTGPDDPLFWDQLNHQSLCWSCHSIKTNTTDRGKGRGARGG